jgi:DNA-binding winged helix-turn-helix (wHTH) protein
MAVTRAAFGSHVFDPDSGNLQCGTVRCRLQAQPAQLLALLIKRRGEIVTREQIRRALWPDTTVSYDQNINFAIRQIRVALGSDAALLQTLPRRGYRFIGEVTDATVMTDGFWRRGVAAAAALLVAAASGFGAGVVLRNGPAGQFVYDHLVHPDRCPYLRVFFPNHHNS